MNTIYFDENETDVDLSSTSKSEDIKYMQSEDEYTSEIEDDNFTELLEKIKNFNVLKIEEDQLENNKHHIEWKNTIDYYQVQWYTYVQKYCPNFRGYVWRLSDIWYSIIDINQTLPIRYLEIGTLCGANLISVCKNFTHPECKFECIDPWEDHDDYNEYKYLQSSNFDNFLFNIKESGEEERILYYKDYSHNIVPKLQDETYDLIYVDGNHESFAVLEDGVNSFRKLKPGGWLIFDDYYFSDSTTLGIDSFLNCYSSKIMNKIVEYGQCYIQKSF